MNGIIKTIIFLMLSPIFFGLLFGVIGAIFNSHAISELAAVMWLVFFTVPVGVVLLVIYGLITSFSSSNKKIDNEES